MNEQPAYHQPVLLEEVMSYMNIQSGKQYIDATVGDGGHTKAILEHGGRVLGIDRDQSALERASARLERFINNKQLRLMSGNFSDLESIADSQGITVADGILLDLGMSSFQINESGRGFSFQKDEPLDMRMDTNLSIVAADLLGGLGENELTVLFTRYGQVPRARLIAKAIVNARKTQPLKTTRQLVELVLLVNPVQGRLHPATKVFMALRMAVNDELNSLSQGLEAATNLLQSGGRLAVISFHQGEDRIVKQFLRSTKEMRSITRKPLTPPAAEIARNPRSRSAKLRIGERQ